MVQEKEKKLRTRFHESNSLGMAPTALSAITVTELPNHAGDILYYITQISSVQGEPNAVRIIWDTKASADADNNRKFHDYVKMQVQSQLLQADRHFIPLTNAHKIGTTNIKCDAYLTPDHILFYADNTKTGTLNVNNEFTTSDRKSIRNFYEGLVLTSPDEWMEFQTLEGNTVHLNKYQDISGLTAQGDTLEMTFSSAKSMTPETVQFKVKDAESIAQHIRTNMTVRTADQVTAGPPQISGSDLPPSPR